MTDSRPSCSRSSCCNRAGEDHSEVAEYLGLVLGELSVGTVVDVRLQATGQQGPLWLREGWLLRAP